MTIKTYRQYKSLVDFVLPLGSQNRNQSDTPVHELCKFAFVSDWGTGTPLARNVMRCIADQKPDILIHLGDVYYSGTKKEMQEHFLSIVREYLPATE